MEESYAACKYLKWISFIHLKILSCVQCEPNFYPYLFTDLTIVKFHVGTFCNANASLNCWNFTAICWFVQGEHEVGKFKHRGFKLLLLHFFLVLLFQAWFSPICRAVKKFGGNIITCLISKKTMQLCVAQR